MLRATTILPAGTWHDSPADRISLDHDARYRRRYRYTAESGTEFLLDLPRAAVLNHGDALQLDDGRLVEVRAAPEALLEITTNTVQQLVRLAWHIGNRHLPAQLDGGRILIREDHVIEAMLEGLGATVKHLRAPFTPESGAYSAADPRGHAHGGAHEHFFVFTDGHGHGH